ncbi:hypothetical protein E2C01_015631 [Portunus trituberculatus]|uniref:Uncharacterized protein n=1 Tax=Portunus trituberculatus TaxID=210409 RepID=A0A5B7DNL9_PORTR|nr:hypothetical protein [Portunus trituberculatus]
MTKQGTKREQSIPREITESRVLEEEATRTTLPSSLEPIRDPAWGCLTFQGVSTGLLRRLTFSGRVIVY